MYKKRISLLVSCMVISNLYSAPVSVITGIVNDPNSTINTPYVIAIAPDGKTGYVSNNGNGVSVVDLTQNPATVIGVVNDPYNYLLALVGITISPDGTKAYAAVINTGSVVVIDLTEFPATAVSQITEPYLAPLYIAFSPDGTQAFVTYGGSNAVGIIDVMHDTFVGLIDDTLAPFNGPAQLAFINQNKAYVVNQSGDTISVIDVASHATTHYVTNPIGAFFSPFAIAISPDGTKAYVSDSTTGGPRFHVIATANDTVISMLTNSLFQDGTGIAFTPDGSTAYASQGDSNYVVIIDAINNTVADPATVTDLQPPTFGGPQGIAIMPNGRTGYIVNTQGNTVSIMSITSVFPPTAFQGCKTQNKFLIQTDYINNLTWAAPTTGNPPVSYTISSSTGPIATIPATAPLQYLVHNCNPNIVYTYSIVATDVYGNVSDPVSTTVTSFCS